MDRNRVLPVPVVRPAARPRSPWTPEEMAAFAADPYAPLPGRTRAALLSRRFECGLSAARPSRLDQTWTPEEIAQLLATPSTVLPGRSASSVSCKRSRMARSKRLAAETWTNSEDEMVKSGIKPLGRTKNAYASRRGLLGLTDTQTRWTDDELARLRLVYGKMPARLIASEFPGRTRSAIDYIGRRHFGPHGVRCFVLAAPNVIIRQSASDLMSVLDAAVPRGLPHHVRSDVIGDLALRFLENDMDTGDLPRQVRLALTSHYRMHPVMGAPVSLDAPMFDDGPPLVERLHRGLWDDCGPDAT